MAEWSDGETRHIQGSGKNPYKLMFKGGVYSCDCPAWRNAGGPIDKRTCKHLKKERGAALEESRVSGSSLALNVAGVASGRSSASSPNSSNPPRQEPGPGLQFFGCACERGSCCDVVHDPDACACAMCSGDGVTPTERTSLMEKAVGRKLRPDEKVKLNGPPVLLAHNFEDADVDPTGWWLSEKLDGVRAFWNGRNFISRQGNIFHAPDWFKAGLPDHPLDGELWMGRKKFQDTLSVVRSVDAGDRWRGVTFLVFDMPHLDLPFEDRVSRIEDWHFAASPPYAQPVKHSPVEGGVHGLKKDLEETVSLGGEGLMIRKPGSKYEVGRSHTLYKVKLWKEAEAVVVGHEPGKGRHKGRTGGLVVRTPEGIEFNIGTGLSDADRKSPPKVGSTVTYRHMEKTDAGVPKGASYVCTRDYE